MNATRSIAVTIAVLLLIGAFSPLIPPEVTISPTVTTQAETTTPTQATSPPTQATAPPTQVTAPPTEVTFPPEAPAAGLASEDVSAGDQSLLDSDRYFADRMLFDEAFLYFREVAFEMEYGGAAGRLKRWNEPLKVVVEGDYTADDYATFEQLLAWLNQIEGMPLIQIVPEANNHVFMFYPLAELEAAIADYPPGNWGLTSIWWDDAGHMTDAIAAVATDVTDQIQRNHLIQEEFIQSLGLLNDSYDLPDSIFQQDWTVTQYPLAIDFAVTRMLYSPALNMSMSADEAYTALLAYYGFDLTAPPSAGGLTQKDVSAGDKALLDSNRYFVDRVLFDEAFSYFRQLAFDAPIGDDTGRLKRWNQPLNVIVEGGCTNDDYATFEQLLVWLNQIDGMPPLNIVTDAGSLALKFHPLAELETIAEYPPGSWGFTYLWWDGDGQITDGIAAVASDVTDQIQRNHLILDEFISSLGLLNKSSDLPDSIFQLDWTETQFPLAIDFAVIRLLYSPALTMSMNVDESYAALLSYYGFE